jgi:NAD(P)-dependent dehydrogenase (short-subunit alcohol dehydrogenase family)
VTGASSGIGRAVAQTLAGRGYDLTVVGRDHDRLVDAARLLSDGGRQVQTVAVDLGGPDGAEQALEAHRARFGRLDFVVANAGAGRRADVADTDRRSLRRLLDVHVESAFALARVALPMLRRPAGGEPAWFVATASISGLVPTPGFAAYSAAKSALVSLIASINAEEGDRGVRACALCPGFVDTAMTAPVRDALAAGDMLRPEDVAAAVAFLLSLSPQAVVGQLVIGRAGAGPFQP